MGIFDEVVDRTRSNSMKWNRAAEFLTADEAAADPLPMWVADTDFKAPQVVLDALHEAVDYGVFGYPGGASESYLKAVTGWQARRFGWDVPVEWIVQTSGIITTLKTAIQAFSSPGDSVLIQPPVYVHFHEDVLRNGRHLALAPLERTADGYRFDARTFEAAIRPDTRLFILSHPHNPTGNVWSEQDLTAMGEICARHGVLVISDEIHQDLVINPHKRHIPFASLREAFARNSITCTAPSKTFYLRGGHGQSQGAADRLALPRVDGLPGPRYGRRGPRQVHADPRAAVAGQGPEVRARGPRLHAREPRLPTLHRRRGDQSTH